jgi:dimeric dUTPase (all-alpha-NTP-PPase superfamily)
MSEITLEQLYEMQKVLDAKIIKEKGLEGQDLLPNTILALQVEIAELANEWRGFKHWSKDQEPRTAVKVPCNSCVFGADYCEECGGNGWTERNNLLEEYVDCLHFLLSIARQLDLPASDLYSWEDELEGETNKIFIELLHNVGLVLADKLLEREIEDVPAFRRAHFRAALFIFYGLGEQRLGLSYEQITEAYLSKNKVNHQRQENGY